MEAKGGHIFSFGNNRNVASQKDLVIITEMCGHLSWFLVYSEVKLVGKSDLIL